ncbi:MAG: hypothetical protein ACHQIL_07285 [Steroidobacterales bacterium]
MDTEQLAQEFIDRTLAKEAFTHQAHLRVGLWHVLRYPADEALDLLRERIRSFNVAKGGENTASAGYHETITRFYLVIIRQFTGSADPHRPIDELAQELIERFGDRELPLRYFTRARLYSAEARLAWLEPDLKPLDHPA